MNSSKTNFLDRFNGKIGVISKNGKILTRSSFEEIPIKKPLNENNCILNKKNILRKLPELSLTNVSYP